MTQGQSSPQLSEPSVEGRQFPQGQAWEQSDLTKVQNQVAAARFFYHLGKPA